MSAIRYLNVPCTILIKGPQAHQRLCELTKRLYGDDAYPHSYRCSRCGLEWKHASVGDEWLNVTCSNCYSDRVVLIEARLIFQDWGEQNGGKVERDARYERAASETAVAREAISALKSVTQEGAVR